MKTFAQLSVEYLDHRAATGTTPGCLRDEKSLLREFAQWMEREGVASPETLGSDHLMRWQRAFVATPNVRTGLPRQAKSINNALGSLRGFLTWLARMGKLPGQLVDKVVRLKPPPFVAKGASNHRKIRAVLRAMPKDTPEKFTTFALLEFMYSSGARLGEVSRLKVNDVELASNIVRLRGRNGKERVVPFGKHAHKVLQDYLTVVRPKLLRNPDEDAFWLGRFAPLTKDSIQRRLQKLRRYSPEAAGLTSVVVRRNCATEMSRGGASLYAIKTQLGHKDLQTIRHYINLTFEDVQKTHAACHPRDRF